MKINTPPSQNSARLPMPLKTADAKASATVPSPSSAVSRSSSSISSILRAAGLPADKLSASIAAFSRFFALPLKPEIMTSIRRQAFTQSDTAAKNGEGARETMSLALAAAESKGVELQPKALQLYAEYLDPDWQEQKQNDEHNNKQTEIITPDNLKKTASENSEKDDVLAILNRLPLKNGKRWIVMPFEFKTDKSEIKVSLRVLVDVQQAKNRSNYMVLDIKEYGESEERRLFVLESLNEMPCRLSVYLQTELSSRERNSFIKELSALLEIPKDSITLKSFTDTEHFPFESGHLDNLHTIDESI